MHQGRIPSRSTMDEGARLWMTRTAIEQYWRVAHWISIEDLLQDGALLWVITEQRYPDVSNPAHRMALFKRIFSNHLHDLANNRTLQAEVPFSGLDESSLEEALEGCCCEFADLLQMVTEAPAKVRQLLGRLLADPTSMLVPYRRDGSLRETLNERFCQIAGFDPNTDNLHRSMRIAMGR